ncbi:MAG TPA: SDR family oxidoreductase [Solirubrobacteraceae bacterium]|nr:SDR family oxidoreductase [Solirubrobacteraceae bacterium]
MSGALEGQLVVVLGGSAGIGLETARAARGEGAEVILTGRNAERLEAAAADVAAQSTAAFDAGDPAALGEFFGGLTVGVDQILVTAGRPTYAQLADMSAADVRNVVSDHIALTLEVARHVPAHMRPGGCLILLGGTGGRSPRAPSTVAAVTAAMPALTRSLGLELAPVRVNLIAPGFVDTPLSAELLGDDLDQRRDELARTLPIRRVVGPADVAALAVHLMTNTALTGATFDIDGGQQLLD